MAARIFIFPPVLRLDAPRVLQLEAEMWVWGSNVLLNPLQRDGRGASLIEHALLISLITLAVLGFVIAVGNWANRVWVNFTP